MYNQILSFQKSLIDVSTSIVQQKYLHFNWQKPGQFLPQAISLTFKETICVSLIECFLMINLSR